MPVNVYEISYFDDGYGDYETFIGTEDELYKRIEDMYSFNGFNYISYSLIEGRIEEV